MHVIDGNRTWTLEPGVDALHHRGAAVIPPSINVNQTTLPESYMTYFLSHLDN